MHIVDLSLPINRQMTGIPKIGEYDDNPTRCVVLTALSEDHVGRLSADGLETVPDPDITHHMMSRVEIVTHIGTHIDAPAHFIENGNTIDQVPLEKIVKKGRIVPLTDTEPGGPVTADAVLATGVEIDASIIPILHTGWTEKTWGTDDFWDNMTYLDTSISELMIERGVSAVAIDCFPEIPFWRDGMERDTSKPPGPNHRALLGNNTIIIQMLTNISAIVGEDNFTLVAVPLRLEGLDGSPARVFAMVG